MLEKIIIAGAGGQGNLFIGEVLCLAALIENKNVTFLPSYGPQMRGGKSTAMVVISDKEIGSPIVASPDVLIVMNGLSLDYIQNVRLNGLVIINRSLAEYLGERKDVRIINVEIASILEKFKTPKILNMILLGAYIKHTDIVKLASVIEALNEKLEEESKEKFFEINRLALVAGYELF